VEQEKRKKKNKKISYKKKKSKQESKKNHFSVNESGKLKLSKRKEIRKRRARDKSREFSR
jgi:hypothetical protein